MDALSPLLAACDLQGWLFSRAELTEPWAVSTRGASTTLFHVVLEGRGRIEAAGQRWDFSTGDLLWLPQGAPHVVTGLAAAEARPIRELPAQPGPGLRTVVHGGGGERTTLLCGLLTLSPDLAPHLLPHLPTLLHQRSGDSALTRWIQATLNLLEGETRRSPVGSEALTRRVAEVLWVQALRTWVEGPDAPKAGWLAALRDPHLTRALAAVHADPAEPWTAATLARRCGLSRTLLYERFEATVGESPADYLTRWRMVLACKQLRRPEARVGEVGRGVGYASDAAFSRAFKRHLGVSPKAWQAQHAPPAAGGPPGR